jgi:hypothetical protein
VADIGDAPIVAPSRTGEFVPHIQTGHPTPVADIGGAPIVAPSRTGEFVPHIEIAHPEACASPARPIITTNVVIATAHRMFLTLSSFMLPKEGAMTVPP